MRELSAAAVQRAVAGMVIDANCRISPEVLRQLERCRTQEERPLAAAGQPLEHRCGAGRALTGLVLQPDTGAFLQPVLRVRAAASIDASILFILLYPFPCSFCLLLLF